MRATEGSRGRWQVGPGSGRGRVRAVRGAGTERGTRVFCWAARLGLLGLAGEGWAEGEQGRRRRVGLEEELGWAAVWVWVWV